MYKTTIVSIITNLNPLPFNDLERLKLWLCALQINLNTLKKTLRGHCILVCSNHFSPDDLIQREERTFPTPTAVPSTAHAVNQKASGTANDTALPIRLSSFLKKYDVILLCFHQRLVVTCYFGQPPSHPGCSGRCWRRVGCRRLTHVRKNIANFIGLR